MALGLAVDGGPARSQAINPDLWGVDNTVLALTRSGTTLYVGGAFNWVGPCTGGLAALPRRSSIPLVSFPKVTGYVYRVAPDGDGGWFIAGNFAAVGGLPRDGLAHILADGSVAAWNPSPNHVPYGVGWLLVSGNTVYVSGGFATISGKPRQYIAALDATTGEALDWDAHADGLVAPLAVHENTLYVGGYFDHIGGQPRFDLAALDATTGSATPWDPKADGTVSSVLFRGGHLYVAGGFSHIGGQARTGLAELDSRTGFADDWNPKVEPANNRSLTDMTVCGGQLYVGGYFKAIDGEPRQSLAAFDLHTGRLTDWNPGSEFAANGYPIVFALESQGHSIYAGGQFDHIGGKARNDVAELDARSGEATDWNPNPNKIVWTIGAADGLVLIGGWMKSVGMVARHNLAAFDLGTGRVKDWNANLDGVEVNALALREGLLYAGGAFWNAGGKPRSMLAAFDTLTGTATDWNPNADDLVNTLLVRGDRIYAGGNFNHVGGLPRNYLAALDASTGAVLPWDPAPNDYVEALTAIGSTIYAGGWFTQVGGLDRNSLAALDAGSGVVLPWRADARSVVSTLTTVGNTLYLGGPFEHVNDQPRNGLAAVDGTTGALLPWDPRPTGPREDANYTSIHALAAHGSTVFVGGDFTQIGGQARASLAALDGVNGAALAWDPSPDQSVWALDASFDQLFAGGFFQAVARVPHLALAGIGYPWERPRAIPADPLASMSPSPEAVTLEPIAPNPVRASARVHYSLPAAAAVSLEIYDLQGRRLETVLDHAYQPAGDHELSVITSRWPAGCYLYRLEAGGVTLTRKVAVVR